MHLYGVRITYSLSVTLLMVGLEPSVGEASWARSLKPGIVNSESVVIVVNSVICESWPPVCTHRPSRCPVSDASEVVTRCQYWKVWVDALHLESLGLRANWDA